MLENEHLVRGNILKRRMILLFMFLLYVSFCFSQFGGGDGSEVSPWQVATATHLDNIREYLGANHENKHWIQTAHINLDTEPWNQGAGWIPIGNLENDFHGKYNGNGFHISGLTISPPTIHEYTGLFGSTRGAVLKNLAVIDVNISNVGYRSGTVVGSLDSSTILDSYATGVVSAGNGNQISGLIGVTNNSLITNCWSDVDFTTLGSWCGGIVGTFVGGTMRDCYSIGNVTSIRVGAQNIGGLMGMNSRGTVISSYSTSVVTAPLGVTRVGGLIGRSLDGTVTHCYATGRVSNHGGVNEEGGLIGGELEGNVNSCYWNVESTGITTSAGGVGKTTVQMMERNTFAGWDFDEVWDISFEGEDCYPWLQHQEAPGYFNYPKMLPPTDIKIYITGQPRVSLSWSPPSFGVPRNYNIYRNDEYLDSVEFGTNVYNDDEVEEYVLYSYKLTGMYGEFESDLSSAISATPVPDGFHQGRGFINDPYQIATATHLSYVRHNLYAHYLQIDDIDLEEYGNWQPIGGPDVNERFRGSYNGNGFSILNMRINDIESDYLGLFSYLSKGIDGGIIKNVNLGCIDISGRNYLGGLVAATSAGCVIDSCSVAGSIVSNGTTLSAFAGGLVGNLVSTSVKHSSAIGSVQAVTNHVGGFVGYNSLGNIASCYAIVSVTGRQYVGGFVGYHNGSIIDSYARGSVSGEDAAIGGFTGYVSGGTIRNSYSSGLVTARQNTDHVGGFVGQFNPGTVEGSYWDMESSRYQRSAAGEGRLTRQMVYPHDQTTYVGWNWEETWAGDTHDLMNDGYPYLQWQPFIVRPHPDVATNPQPEDEAVDVSIDIENVRWTYTMNPMFTDPVGFRVYMNTTGEFGETDDFIWIPFDDEEENYSTADVLPDELQLNTTYYWKVVPTTDGPDRRDNARSRKNNSSLLRDANFENRGDALDVPVWRFTTQPNPNPVVATNPQPENEAIDVLVELEQLAWSFNINPEYANPVGFRVYLNTSGDFDDEEDEFHWIGFMQNQTNYNCSSILPNELEYATTYYWKVVPTTDAPQRADKNRRRSFSVVDNRNTALSRGDAENVPVWSFSTVLANPNPQPAVNPSPEHLAAGISSGLDTVSWEYHLNDIYTDPVGFRVYMNTTGGFGSNTHYIWVDYVEDQEVYYCSEIVPTPLDVHTTYYWKVVPTTIHPDERNNKKTRLETYTRNIDNNLRGDAYGCPTWRFTTGATGVDVDVPCVTEIYGNYPNPFNPATTISFALEKEKQVTLTIFNSKGQQIKVLIDERLRAGKHNVLWNGKDGDGKDVGSGIYLYRMKAGDFTSTKKMILIK